MAGIKIEGFQGIAPRLSATLLEQNQAQIAFNLELLSGTIRPWRGPSPVYLPYTPPATPVHIPLIANAETVYRLNNGTNDCWLSWANDVDYVPGVVADVSDYRVYYTGDPTPRKTNYALASTGAGPWPAAYYEMGVPGPTVAPTLTVGGSGAAPSTTYAYVYTWVSVFGSVYEESAPSPATLATATTGQTITISGFGTPPTGNYNYQYLRIYRTVTGTSSVIYQMLVQLAVTATTYTDSTPTTLLVGGNLNSLNWGPPPSNLKGLVSMPNGILAGFVANEVWFSEPYYPHAWPSIYTLTVDYPIVGLAVSGSTLYVLTTRNPYAITGVSPSTMSQVKLDIVEGCVAKRSIAADQFGVIYASPNGLVSLNPSQQDIITRQLYSYDDWRALGPSTIFARIYNSIYYMQLPPNTALAFMRADTPPLTEFTYYARGLYVDPVTNYLYSINSQDGYLYQLDADATTPASYTWKSKRFLQPEELSFSAVQIDADYAGAYATQTAYYNNVVAANQTLFTATGAAWTGGFDVGTFDQFMYGAGVLAPLPEAGYASLTLTIWADGVQVYQGLFTSLEAVRIPAVRGYAWEFQVSGTIGVRSIGVATSVQELKQRGSFGKQIKYAY